MLEWRKMTKQINWQAVQPSQVVCISDLRCWGAWDTTCGHKAKAVTPSIAGRKETALHSLPWKDERGMLSIGQTWNWGKGYIGETHERWGIDNILNCTVTCVWYLSQSVCGQITGNCFSSPVIKRGPVWKSKELKVAVWLQSMGHCVHIGSIWGDFFPLHFVDGFFLHTASLPHPRRKHTQKE